MMNFLITGKVNSGKSTLVHRLVEKADFTCGGVISLPVFENGIKAGMDALDILTGEKKPIARLDGIEGIKVGKYIISIQGLEHGKNAIIKAIGDCDAIIIDEFGHLEMKGMGMAEAAEKAIEGGNAVVVLRHSLKKEFMEKHGGHEFVVIDSGSISPDVLADIIKKCLGHNRKL